MRAAALLAAVLVLAAPAARAEQHESQEPFTEFLARFVHDEPFRLSRIKFPLRAILGNPTDPRVREKWVRSQFDEKFAVPLTSDGLEKKGLEQAISYPSASDVEVQQSQPESD